MTQPKSYVAVVTQEDVTDPVNSEILDPEKSSKAGAIVGIIFSVLFTLGIAAAVVYHFMKRKEAGE